MCGPIQLFYKSIGKFEFLNRFAVIKMQHPVKTNSGFRNNKGIHRDFSLNRTGSSYPDDIQGSQFFFYCFSFKIDIYKCIQLVQNYIYIVGPNSGRYYAYAFSFINSGLGMKFPFLNAEFYLVKIFCHQVNAILIPNNNNGLCYMFRQ